MAIEWSHCTKLRFQRGPSAVINFSVNVKFDYEWKSSLNTKKNYCVGKNDPATFPIFPKFSFFNDSLARFYHQIWISTFEIHILGRSQKFLKFCKNLHLFNIDIISKSKYFLIDKSMIENAKNPAQSNQIKFAFFLPGSLTPLLTAILWRQRKMSWKYLKRYELSWIGSNHRMVPFCA